MWIQDEIAAGVTRVGADAIELSPDEAKAAEALLERVFAKPGTGLLWERLHESQGLHDPNAWRRLPDFVRAPSLLLVHHSQGRCGYRFEIPADLPLVLADCPSFEFYVTDGQGEYLLAFNHHDVLVGCGHAAAWVSSLVRRSDPGVRQGKPG